MGQSLSEVGNDYLFLVVLVTLFLPVVGLLYWCTVVGLVCIFLWILLHGWLYRLSGLILFSWYCIYSWQLFIIAYAACRFCIENSSRAWKQPSQLRTAQYFVTQRPWLGNAICFFVAQFFVFSCSLGWCYLWNLYLSHAFLVFESTYFDFWVFTSFMFLVEL